MNHGQESPDKFTRAVTNETFLFSYRVIVSLGSLYLAFVATKILNTNDNLQATVASFRYDTAIVLAETKGKVDVINSRVDALSNRLTTLDRSVDATNERIMDIIKNRPVVRPQ